MELNKQCVLDTINGMQSIEHKLKEIIQEIIHRYETPFDISGSWEFDFESKRIIITVTEYDSITPRIVKCAIHRIPYSILYVKNWKKQLKKEIGTI